MAKPLRIFISSPGDVVPERRRAALVIEKLAKDYARFFEVRPYLWETEPMLASGTFQDAIVPPGEADILVLILWARLGTPLPERTTTQEYRGIDGRSPVTGTEWEFEAALAAHRKRGAPDLLAYRKSASPQAEFRSDADLEELRNQLRKLNAFWQRHFVDQGEFRAAFGEFTDLDSFEARLEVNLRALIERRITSSHDEPDRSSAPKWLHGSPFLGLETYRFEHSPIFFGRTESTKIAVEQLLGNAGQHRPFLLVLGASGTGKSSLVQAGIVPAMAVRGVVPGIGLWRRAVLRPGGHPNGPFMALATALSDEDALPELLKGQNVADLARHLETATTNPGFPIVSALAGREEGARRNGDLMSFEEMRLVLVVDQLEELFTFGEVTPEQRKAFILCLKGLMDSGRVFIIATMRSDYWHRAAEVPALVALAEGHCRLDLLPPTQAEITEMIRRPAEVARLSFEIEARTEIRLDAALTDEASREPGALPLLSFLLDALYKKDVGEGGGSTLRYASMAVIGGLKGAIAARAEAAFAALALDAQSALPNVLRALVTVSRSGAEPTARVMPMERFAEGSPERRFVDALLDPQVRLLVADGDGSGARVRLAHEALITHWDRARRQIAQDRDDLRTRAMVEEAEAQWRSAEGRNRRGYLLRDPQLANATDLAKRWGGEFNQLTFEFIQASRQRARRVQQLAMAAVAVLALTTITASILGVLAYKAERTASNERDRAEVQRNEALVTQSRFLADRARQNLVKGDAGTAILLALDALPNTQAVTARPYVPEADLQLEGAWRALRENMVLIGHQGSVSSAAFSSDGKRIVTASQDKTARLWDAESGKQIGAPLSGHTEALSSAAFSPDGKRIVTASYDRTVRLWNAETGQQIGAPLRGHTNIVNSAAFSPDGKRIVTASFDGTARLWDAETGQQIGAPFTGHQVAVYSAAFSPDGKRIVTSSYDSTVRLWHAETGQQIGAPLIGHEGTVWSAVFSPDGERILSASEDRKVRQWDARTGQPTGVMITLLVPARSAAFSPDGKRIVTTTVDGAVQLWTAETGQPIVALSHNGVYGAVFSPDGKRIVTASSDNTAQLWDAETDKPKGELTGHTKTVHSVTFSPDGKRILSASDDRTIRLWDAETGQSIRVITLPVSAASTADFSPDGKRIVAACYDKTVRLWNAETGQEIGAPLTGHTNFVNSAAFSHDGKRILSASDDGSVRLWDAETGQPIRVIDAGAVRAAFSPDSKRIVATTRGWELQQWHADTGQPIGPPFKGHRAAIDSVAYSPDGKRIVTAASDWSARQWDAETGKQIGAPLKGDEMYVKSAVFSRDGKRIVTGSDAARVWDAETGKQIGLPLGSYTYGAVFSPDGKRIVTASGTRVRLWTIFATTEELVEQAKTSVPRCLTRAQREAAFLDPEPPIWCIELEKWPYETQNWKDWLTYKRAKADPPLPDTSAWKDWVSNRKSNSLMQ